MVRARKIVQASIAIFSILGSFSIVPAQEVKIGAGAAPTETFLKKIEDPI